MTILFVNFVLILRQLQRTKKYHFHEAQMAPKIANHGSQQLSSIALPVAWRRPDQAHQHCPHIIGHGACAWFRRSMCLGQDICTGSHMLNVLNYYILPIHPDPSLFSFWFAGSFIPKFHVLWSFFLPHCCHHCHHHHRRNQPPSANNVFDHEVGCCVMVVVVVNVVVSVRW